MKRRKLFGYLSILTVLLCAFLLMGVSCSVSTANIQNATMTTAVDEEGKPLDSVTEFPLYTDVYVAAELHNAPDDTIITFIWYLENEPVGEYSLNNTLSDQYIQSNIAAEFMTQPGNYKAEIYIDEREEPDASLEFTVQ